MTVGTRRVSVAIENDRFTRRVQIGRICEDVADFLKFRKNVRYRLGKIIAAIMTGKTALGRAIDVRQNARCLPNQASGGSVMRDVT